jgi:hypothetical protein
MGKQFEGVSAELVDMADQKRAAWAGRRTGVRDHTCQGILVSKAV